MMRRVLFRDREERLIERGYLLTFRMGHGKKTEILVQEPGVGEPFWIPLENDPSGETRTLIPTLLKGDEEYAKRLKAANLLVASLVFFVHADDALQRGENGEYVAWTDLAEMFEMASQYPSQHSPLRSDGFQTPLPYWHFYSQVSRHLSDETDPSLGSSASRSRCHRNLEKS